MNQDPITAHSGTRHAVTPEHVKLWTSTTSNDEIRAGNRELCGTCDDESDSVGCGSVPERDAEDGKLSEEGTESMDVTAIERRKPGAVEDTRTRQRKQRVPSPSRTSSRLALESMFVGTLSEDHPTTKQKNPPEESKKAMVHEIC